MKGSMKTEHKGPRPIPVTSLRTLKPGISMTFGFTVHRYFRFGFLLSFEAFYSQLDGWRPPFPVEITIFNIEIPTIPMAFGHNAAKLFVFDADTTEFVSKGD
jgi:hypothetical protein